MQQTVNNWKVTFLSGKRVLTNMCYIEVYAKECKIEIIGYFGCRSLLLLARQHTGSVLFLIISRQHIGLIYKRFDCDASQLSV